MHLWAGLFQDFGRLDWTVGEVLSVDILSCRFRVKGISNLKMTVMHRLLSDGIETLRNKYKLPREYIEDSQADHLIRDEGEAKRVEPFQKAPAISSILI